MAFQRAGGHRIEYEWFGPATGTPAIVLLHEGLGSVSSWRDFPMRVAGATGSRVLAYSRYGHGRSDRLTAARATDFMHEEALRALPELLDALGVERPVLLGHSDGASIALIYAGGSGREVAGVIAMAPHVMVEELCIARIRETAAAFEASGLRARLARHHDDPDLTFRGWSDIWLAPDFREWSIVEFLPRLPCPVLAVQGENDDYGTMLQVERIAAEAADVELVKLRDCGHSPHRDRLQAVLEAVSRFVRRLASR